MRLAEDTEGATLWPAPLETPEPLSLGAGLDGVDDVRVWTRARTRAELLATMDDLPAPKVIDACGAGWDGEVWRETDGDPDLALRLTFDFDTDDVAHNARVRCTGGQPQADGPTGTYLSGAEASLYGEGQPLSASFALRAPGTTGADKQGLFVAGGLRLEAPGAIQGMLGLGDTGLALATRLAFGLGTDDGLTLSGSAYSQALTVSLLAPRAPLGVFTSPAVAPTASTATWMTASTARSICWPRCSTSACACSTARAPPATSPRACA